MKDGQKFAYASDEDPRADRLFRQVIKDHFEWLGMFRVELIFRPEAQVSCGKPVWGKAQLATAREKEFDSIDAWVIIPVDVWKGLSDFQKEALLFHELYHFTIAENDAEKLTLRRHDLEEFIAVYERYGKWEPAIEQFADAVEQMPLPGMPAPASPLSADGDPDVSDLHPRELESVTIEAGGQAVTLSPETFAKLPRNLHKLNEIAELRGKLSCGERLTDSERARLERLERETAELRAGVLPDPAEGVTMTPEQAQARAAELAGAAADVSARNLKDMADLLPAETVAEYSEIREKIAALDAEKAALPAGARLSGGKRRTLAALHDRASEILMDAMEAEQAAHQIQEAETDLAGAELAPGSTITGQAPVDAAAEGVA